MPPELMDILVCEAMGWSWRALQETPPEVVADVVVLLKKRVAVAKIRAAVGRKT